MSCHQDFKHRRDSIFYYVHWLLFFSLHFSCFKQLFYCCVSKRSNSRRAIGVWDSPTLGNGVLIFLGRPSCTLQFSFLSWTHLCDISKYKIRRIMYNDFCYRWCICGCTCMINIYKRVHNNENAHFISYMYASTCVFDMHLFVHLLYLIPIFDV